MSPRKKTARTKKTSESRRVAAILRILAKTYPTPTTALHHESVLQLLVSTILSAQCTDDRVNQVTPGLFAAYPSAEALANAPTPALEQIIRATGFFRAKTRSIQGACRILSDRYGGQVPRQMDQLLELPGVARKTANVVLGTAFGIPSGIVVDTHVRRLAGRLALSDQKDPSKIERDLMAIIPRAKWIDLGHQLILHGRAVCKARKPACDRCPLAAHCPSAGTT